MYLCFHAPPTDWVGRFSIFNRRRKLFQPNNDNMQIRNFPKKKKNYRWPFRRRRDSPSSTFSHHPNTTMHHGSQSPAIRFLLRSFVHCVCRRSSAPGRVPTTSTHFPWQRGAMIWLGKMKIIIMTSINCHAEFNFNVNLWSQFGE